MWTPLLFCLLVAAAQADSSPWKPNTEYKYNMQARTLSALHQVSNQYTGIVVKALVTVQQKSDNVVTVQVNSPHYADLHTNLSHGWSSYIPESQLQYKAIPLSSKPFELIYKNGVINSIVASKDIPIWELNMLKSIASQFQVDTRATNLWKSRINNLPTQQNPSGVYKTMEDSVAGKCETIYDISEMPELIYQNKPQLAPLHNLKADGQLIDIVKTRNFSNCDIMSAYHFGITGDSDWEPASNQMGEFFARSSMSRVVISGDLQRYTIQSSVTTQKVIISPYLFDDQNGMVVSHMNLTLVNVQAASGVPKSLPNPETHKNLVYKYNEAFSDNKQHFGDDRDKSSADSGNENNSQQQNNQWQNNEYDQEGHNQQINGRRPRVARSLFRNEENDQYSGKSLGKDSNENNSNESNQWQKQSGQSDSDSSDSSELWSSNEKYNWQSAKDINHPPPLPFLPFFIGNQGNAIQPTVDEVVALAKNIGHELATPSAIPGQKTLNQFTVLTRIVRTMTHEQMEKVARALKNITGPPICSDDCDDHFKNIPLWDISSSNNRNPRIPTTEGISEKTKLYWAWKAFRDAVAQAGTGPALLTIKSWIKNSVVKEEEAAELLSVLSNTAIHPNSEYMREFFSLLEDSNVQHQQYLNTSAIISFTDLARKALVSNDTTYNRFPVHAFGPLKSFRDQPVVNQYIPYFEKQLRQAVSDQDSIKILTFIRALGNLGHARILKVFEPYLEGKQPMTHFQRLTIVASLNKLAKVYPKVARAVFYRIYQNTGEATELRVAAVFQIMKTNPPAQMLQRMAEFTNYDEDTQVTSAVQSAIRSAAYNLEEPDDQELKSNAQSAVNLLNHKDMSLQYSKNYLRSYYPDELNLAYRQSYSHIGSDDGLYPKSIYYNLRQNNGGFKRSTGVGVMSSSFYALQDLFKDQFKRNSVDYEADNQQGQASDLTWSKIGKLLNIQPSEQEQVEASVLFDTIVGKRFFAFDNQTIEQLPRYVKEWAKKYSVQQSFDFTKFAQSYALTVAFPTATGFPFIYSLETPTLLQFRGKAQANSSPHLDQGDYEEIPVPKSVNVAAEMSFLWSRRYQSAMGFVTPYNHKHYTAGINRNIQINLPLNVELEFDSNNGVALEVSPSNQNNKQNVFEYSTKPYTSKHDILDMAKNANHELQEDNNRRVIHVRKPNQIHKTIGQESTGFAFDFKYISEQRTIDISQIFKQLHKHDFISAFVYAWAEDSNNFNNITIAYNPQKSSANSVQFVAAFDEETFDNDEEDDDDNNDDENNDRSSSRDEDQSDKNIKIRHTRFGQGYKKNQNNQYHYKHHQNNQFVQSRRKQASSRVFTNYRSLKAQNAKPNNQILLGAKAAQPSSSEPRVQARAYMNKIEQNIRGSDSSQDVNMRVFVLSADFQGQSKASYTVAGAYGSSYVLPTSSYIFYAHKKPAHPNKDNEEKEVLFYAEHSQPNVPMMNYKDAADADPTSYFDAGLQVYKGDGSSVEAVVAFKGVLEQSSARRQYLEQSALVQQCHQQMSKGNTVQDACRNATSQANLLDRVKFSVKYEKVPSSWKNATYKAYSALRYLWYPYNYEDVVSAKNTDGEIQLNFQYAPDFQSVNVTIDAPTLSSQINNLRLNKYASAFLVSHPEYSPYDLLAQQAFRGHHYPSCVVDNNQAETFDNKSYPINLGRCWHAMFHSTPKNDPTENGYYDEDKVSVLVRDSSSGQATQKDVKIMIGSSSIYLSPSNGASHQDQPQLSQDDSNQDDSNQDQPSQGYSQDDSHQYQGHNQQFVFNNQRVTINYDNEVETYENKFFKFYVMDKVIAAFYQQLNGEVRVFLPQHSIEIQYDGTAIKLKADNSYRSEVRGLCGTFNTQPADDFTVPQDCTLQNAYEFAASYALTEEHSCQGPAKQYKQAAQHSISNGQCYSNDVIYGNYVSSSDYNRSNNQRSAQLKSITPSFFNKAHSRRNYQNQHQGTSSCTDKQTIVMQRDGKVCFSTKPQIQCLPGCYPKGQVQKQVEFYCTEESPSTQYWKTQSTPDFSNKKSTVTYNYSLPEGCVTRHYY